MLKSLRMRLSLTVLVSLFFLSFFPVSAQALRETICFNPDWRFTKSDPPGAELPGFDDSRWETVSTPHSFNDTDTFDDWALPNLQGEGSQWGGRTWYRKHFTAPENWRGKTVIIEFEAVRQVAEVYLNGRRIGKNSSGFVPFAFDLTPFLEIGRPNVLAVMCDNSFAVSKKLKKKNEPSVLDEARLPWNNPQWHPAHGGIYRNVWLHVLDPIHLTLPIFSDLGTTGTYVYGTDVTADSANIGIESEVTNATARDAVVKLTAEVVDRGGRTVLQLNNTGNLAAGEKKVVKLSGPLAHPQRWEPAYPYLYSVKLTLEADGKIVDRTAVPLGLRSVKFDVATGFSINGHLLKLHGWGQKPTSEWAGLASAYPDWMHYYTVRLMQEAGGNFIRWGHCAGGPAQIAADDQYGQITDQPGVDGESDIKNEAQWKIRAAAFRDTLIYYRNNPSILIWEGGNQKVTNAHARELRGYKDQYDSNGGRAYAHRRADATTGRYMEVSIGTEGSHEERQLPVVEGEYDREESPRRVWDRLTPPNENYRGRGTYNLTSEQFAVNEVSQWWRRIGSDPAHCGGANWIFSDSTSGGRDTSEVTRASGEVDAVRLPKEAYYACTGMFRSTPTAFIIGHWNYAPGVVKNVCVVSNQPKVELFINGKSAGLGTQSDQYLYTFPNVMWEPGEIKAVAYGADGKPAAEQKKITAGPAVALRITPMTGPTGLRANGSDIVLFDVEAVDAKGNRVPTVEQKVDFTLAGPGIWRGGYNSGKINSTNNTYLDIEAGINRVAVRSTLVPGTITLHASSEGLAPATQSVEARPVQISNGMTQERPAVPEQGTITPYDPSAQPKLIVSAQAAADPTQGRFIDNYSYSGPTSSAMLQRDAEKGKKAFADQPDVFADLPASLQGADYLQLPVADKDYQALDLISLTVGPASVVTIAVDSRQTPLHWMKSGYRKTAETIQIGAITYSLFEHAAAAGTTLTLAGNSEGPSTHTSTMYIVFVKAK